MNYWVTCNAKYQATERQLMENTHKITLEIFMENQNSHKMDSMIVTITKGRCYQLQKMALKRGLTYREPLGASRHERLTH